MDCHGFRYYDAVLGKYSTRDPIGYPDGPNNYLYVNNNPINAIDPLGLMSGAGGEYIMQGLSASGNQSTSSSGPGLFTVLKALLWSDRGEKTGERIGARMMFPLPGDRNEDGSINKTKIISEELGRATKETAAEAIEGGPVAAGIFLITSGKSKKAEKVLDAFDEAKDANKKLKKTKVDTDIKCFPAGTLVIMADGTTKPIQEIKKGEKVLARDPDKESLIDSYEVIETLKNYTLHFIHIHVDKDGDGIADAVVKATGEHPFWTKNKGWKNALDLKYWDVLEDVDEKSLIVLKVEEEEIVADTFNLTVAGVHTFYIKRNGVSILVHNTGKDDKDFIYRELSPEDLEAYKKGEKIQPKGTGGTMAEHVEGNKDTKYISASETPDASDKYKSGSGKAKISKTKLKETGSTVVDNKNLVNNLKKEGTAKNVKNATDAKEVLIKNGIDPEAIVEVKGAPCPKN